MKRKSEYRNFEHLLTQVLSVPHSEIDARLKQEKLDKKRKKAKQSSASREANDRA